MNMAVPLSTDLNIPAVALPTRVHTDHHVLLWQVVGCAGVTCGEDQISLRQAHCLWLPARVSHLVEVEPDSITLPLTFDVETTATTLASLSLLPADPRLPTLALALIQAQLTSQDPPPNVRRQILSLLETTVGQTSKLVMPTSPAARSVAEALRFDPGDERLVQDWARLMATSTRSIERAFLRETGLTLQHWRLRCRMEAAALLIPHSSSIAAVAHRVGYENHSSFGRVFKAHFGVSPTEFRDSWEG